MKIIYDNSICVDASTLGNPGITEYRGLDMKTKKILFEYKLNKATNNIGEFLAIVHALALYKNCNIIYSDSLTAISWVKKKKIKTTLKFDIETEKTHEILNRALNWIKSNKYNTKIIKWPTEKLGDIPADYGRK